MQQKTLFLFLPLIAATALIVAVRPLGQADLPWLLKTGEVIVNTGHIPHYDIFSYTALGAPWCNLSWLSAVILWFFYALLGFNGLILYKTIFALLIAIILFRTFSIFIKSHPISAWGVIIAILSIYVRVQERPHMFTDLFTCLYLFLLYRYITDKRKSLWIIIPIHIFWVNCHLGAVFGLGLLFAFGVGEYLQRFFSSGPQPIAAQKCGHIFLVLIFATIASLINPWGTVSLTFPFENLFAASAIVEYTEELLPSWSQLADNYVYVLLFRIFLIITLISHVLNRRNVRLSFLFIMSVSSLMAFQASRFTSVFFIINTPLTFYNFYDYLSAKREQTCDRRRLSFNTWISAGILLNIILFLTWFGMPLFTNNLNSKYRVGLGVNEYAFPTEAVDFLNKNEIHGRIYNAMGEGGYLIFKRWPGELVHIDGRTPVYGDKFFEEHVDSLRNAHNFEEYLNKFDIDYILLDATEARGFWYLHDYLRRSGIWKLVHASPRSYVYLKDIPKFGDAITRYAISEHPLFKK